MQFEWGENAKWTKRWTKGRKRTTALRTEGKRNQNKHTCGVRVGRKCLFRDVEWGEGESAETNMLRQKYILVVSSTGLYPLPSLVCRSFAQSNKTMSMTVRCLVRCSPCAHYCKVCSSYSCQRQDNKKCLSAVWKQTGPEFTGMLDSSLLSDLL